MKQEAPDTELRLSDEESQSSDPQEVSTTQGTIAGYETKLVQYSKIIFILSVAAAAVAVGCITFLVLRSGEEQAYVDHVSCWSSSPWFFVCLHSKQRSQRTSSAPL